MSTNLVPGSLVGGLLGVLAVLWGVLVGIFPLAWGQSFFPLMFGVLITWSAVWIPWGALVERPHMAKVRAEWEATHILDQSRPR